MKQYFRAEHRTIVEALSLMDHAYLLANECWFGGGTAIVLKLGEYRRSLDVDFICASIDGYRELRSGGLPSTNYGARPRVFGQSMPPDPMSDQPRASRACHCRSDIICRKRVSMPFSRRSFRRIPGLSTVAAATLALAGCQVPFVTDTSRMNPDVFARETAPVFYDPAYAEPVQPQAVPVKEPIPQRRELYQTQFHQTYGLPVSNPVHRAMYGTIRDEGHTLPSIPFSRIDARYLRQQVDYRSNEPAGTIVVDTRARYLYFVQPGGKAIRYGVGLGKAGFAWSGRGVIQRKAKWPRWTPPDDMVARQPDLRQFAAADGGADPGLNNPLGARALYIFKDGKDTLYRVHGTPDWQSVGKQTSSGCVRMLNQDVVDLFDRVPSGTPIVVI